MRKKKPNPDNLFKRGDIWWIRYSVDGKTERHSLKTRSLREAKRLRDEILIGRSARAKFGLELPKQRAQPVHTFGHVAQMWLDSRLADDTLAPSTRQFNRQVVHRILLPVFGTMLMTAITVEHIEQFLCDLRAKYKRSTVSNYFGYLRTIFRRAIKRGWYDGPNPIDRLERIPSQGPGRDTILTLSEAKRLLARLTGAIHYKSALALYTGLRWGEVHGLGWADLALDTTPPTLTVRRSYRGQPKNEASAATVPISPQAAALLRRWQRGQIPACSWLFPDTRGNICSRRPSAGGEAIHVAAMRAGIKKHVTPHVFRHTFGTWVYEQTGDIKMVQRLMRHASFQTSMSYVHDHRDLAPVVNMLPDLTSKPDLKVV